MAVQVRRCKEVFHSHKSAEDSEHEVSDECQCNTCRFARRMLNNVSISTHKVRRSHSSGSSAANSPAPSDSESTDIVQITPKTNRHLNKKQVKSKSKTQLNHVNKKNELIQFEARNVQLSYDFQNEDPRERELTTSPRNINDKESLAKRCQNIVRKLEAQLAQDDYCNSKDTYPKDKRKCGTCCTPSEVVCIQPPVNMETELGNCGCCRCSDALDNTSCHWVEEDETKNLQQSPTFYKCQQKAEKQCADGHCCCRDGKGDTALDCTLKNGMCSIVPKCPLSAPPQCCVPKSRCISDFRDPTRSPSVSEKQWDPSSRWTADGKSTTLNMDGSEECQSTLPNGPHYSYDSPPCQTNPNELELNQPPPCDFSTNQPVSCHTLPCQAKHCQPDPCHGNSLSRQTNEQNELYSSQLISPYREPLSNTSNTYCLPLLMRHISSNQPSPHMPLICQPSSCDPPPSQQPSSANETSNLSQLRSSYLCQASQYDKPPCQPSPFQPSSCQPLLCQLRSCQTSSDQPSLSIPASSRKSSPQHLVMSCQSPTRSRQTAPCQSNPCQLAPCQQPSCQPLSCTPTSSKSPPCQPLCQESSSKPPPCQTSACQPPPCQPAPCQTPPCQTPPSSCQSFPNRSSLSKIANVECPPEQSSATCQCSLPRMPVSNPIQCQPPPCQPSKCEPPPCQSSPSQASPCQTPTCPPPPCQQSRCQPAPCQKTPHQPTFYRSCIRSSSNRQYSPSSFQLSCQQPPCLPSTIAQHSKIMGPPPCAQLPACSSRDVSCECHPGTLSLAPRDRGDYYAQVKRPPETRTEVWVGDCHTRVIPYAPLSCRGSTSQVCVSESMATSGASYYHSAMDLTDGCDEDCQSKINRCLASLDDAGAKFQSTLLHSIIDSRQDTKCAESSAGGCVTQCPIKRERCRSGQPPACSVRCYATGENQCIAGTENVCCCMPNVKCLIDESDMAGCAKLFKAALNRLRNLSLLPCYHCKEKCHCFGTPSCPGKVIDTPCAKSPTPCTNVEPHTCITPSPNTVYEPYKRMVPYNIEPTHTCVARVHSCYKSNQIDKCISTCTPKKDSSVERDFQKHASSFKSSLEHIKAMGNHKYESDTVSEGSGQWHSLTDDMKSMQPTSTCPRHGEISESNVNHLYNNSSSHDRDILPKLQNVTKIADDSSCPAFPKSRAQSFMKNYTRIPEEVIRSAWDDLIQRTMETMQGSCQEKDDTYSDLCRRILRCPAGSNSKALVYPLGQGNSPDGSIYCQNRHLNSNYCEAFGPAWDEMKKLLSSTESTEKSPEGKDNIDKTRVLLNSIEERISIIPNDDSGVTRLRGGFVDNAEKQEKSKDTNLKTETAKIGITFQAPKLNFDTLVDQTKEEAQSPTKRNTPLPPIGTYFRSHSIQSRPTKEAERGGIVCNSKNSLRFKGNCQTSSPLQCEVKTESNSLLDKCNQYNISLSPGYNVNCPDIDQIILRLQSAKT